MSIDDKGDDSLLSTSLQVLCSGARLSLQPQAAAVLHVVPVAHLREVAFTVTL